MLQPRKNKIKKNKKQSANDTVIVGRSMDQATADKIFRSNFRKLKPRAPIPRNVKITKVKNNSGQMQYVYKATVKKKQYEDNKWNR